MSPAANAPYDSILAARYLKALAGRSNYAPNATQLQKLLYIAYGTCLAETETVLLGERPQAWPYGPVFPRVQKKINISEIPSIDESDFAAIKSDNYVSALFERIINDYKNFSAKQLSDWSHSKGSPWDITINKAGGKWSTQISDESIKEYFSKVNV